MKNGIFGNQKDTVLFVCKAVVLTLSVIMDSNMQTDTIQMGLESVSFKGSQVATYVIYAD